MRYSSLADLKNRVAVSRIIKLVDDERLHPDDIDEANPAHAAMLERVNEAIEDADARINAYIGTRYKVPIVPAPDLLRKMSAEIAYYLLLARYNPAIEETWKDLYNNHIALLKRISEGKAILDGAVPSEAEKRAAAGDFIAGQDQLFNRDSLKGW